MFADLSDRYMSLRVAGPACGGRPGDAPGDTPATRLGNASGEARVWIQALPR
jgi:hypothetical protein